MKQRILYLITKSNFGGAQRYVYELATSLPKDQYDVSVAFGGTGKKGALIGTLSTLLENAGIRTHTISSLARDIYITDEIRAFFEILSLIKKEKPDILHINSSKVGGLGALAGRVAGVRPIIFTAHGWPHQEERPFYQKWVIFILSWITVLLSHKTIVVSKKDLVTAPAWFKRNSIVLIPNGIALFEILLKNDAREKILNTVQRVIPTDQPWIGTIAELTKNKGLDVAISALSKTSKGVLIIIGSGEERGRLELMADELGIHHRVFFTGFIPNARTLLSAFDVYLMTSRKEGLPYALLEAGIAGLPIISSRVGGTPDIIEHNSTGLLTPKNTPHDVTVALEKILDISLKQDYGVALKTKVISHFSLNTMIQKTRAVYGERNSIQ